jgi:hypothetical protein
MNYSTGRKTARGGLISFVLISLAVFAAFNFIRHHVPSSKHFAEGMHISPLTTMVSRATNSGTQTLPPLPPVNEEIVQKEVPVQAHATGGDAGRILYFPDAHLLQRSDAYNNHEKIVEKKSENSECSDYSDKSYQTQENNHDSDNR